MLSKRLIINNNNLIFISTIKEIVAINQTNDLFLDNLIGIERQKSLLVKNTDFFLKNKSFNNALLWGAKGMGKSSLIFAIKNHFSKLNKNIKILEVFSSDIKFLPEIIFILSKIKAKFIIFIDDIVLDVNKDDFKILKVLLEGSLLSKCKNIVFYLTSNSRHIIKPETNKGLNDIQSKDQVANTVSLSDRFGLWISFHKCTKEQYLIMVKMYAKKFLIKISEKELEKKAMEWSIEKGDYSGRIAYQFIVNVNTKNL